MPAYAKSIEELRSHLASRPDSELVFEVDGVSIQPGYHITEVKYAQVSSMDCGSCKDQWDELVIELLDGSLSSTESYMKAAKFSGIMDKALESLTAANEAKLFVEFSPGNGSIQKMTVTGFSASENKTTVQLSGSRAACKPMQRVLGSMAAKALSCCGSQAAPSQPKTDSCCSPSETKKQASTSCC